MEGSDKGPSVSNLTLMPMATIAIDLGDLKMTLDILEDSNAIFRFIGTQVLCHALRKQKVGQALEPLLELLDDPDSAVRWGAAVALGELGDQRAVKPLAGRLGDGNIYVRVAVADSLGLLGNAYATKYLLEHLEPDKEKHAAVRAAVARALGKIKDSSSLPPLLGYLEEGEDTPVMLAISEALGNFDDRRAVEPLINALGTPTINMSAAVSLGRLSEHIGDKETLKLLYMLKNGNTYQLRAGCAFAIGEIDRLGTLGYLEEAAENDTSIAVRWAVAKALRKTKNRMVALPILLGLLKKREKQVCEAAVESIIELIGAVVSPPVKEPLSRALICLDDEERGSAIVESAENYLKLAGYLRDDAEKETERRGTERSSFFDYQLRKMEEMAGIRETLRQIETLEEDGGEKAIASLTAFLKDENGHVRKAASDSLERLLQKSDSPEVHAALDDESAGDRVARLRFAAKRMLETKTMMFDGRMLSQKVSKTAVTVLDTPYGKMKTPK